ncbi:MAG: hypothetical protein A2X49_11865 [Lentisphaerae bacterium GWF2_52_8]|nr:MAG: hypothetical protein A2X49_11865 [Lentisphaerae bacterium GWF2_52_8]
MISSLELARLCGVSQGSVDRALHNRPGISDATKEKILAAAAKHGYQPNPAAREILTGKNNTVGALVPHLNSVFFMDLMNEVRKALRQENYRFVLSPVETDEELLEMLSDFSARRYCATIIISHSPLLTIPRNLTRQMKVISLLNPCRGANTHFLSPDELKTGREAVRYLVDRGCRDIIHLTYKRLEFDAVKKRSDGYTEEMCARKLSPTTWAGFDEEQIVKTLRHAQKPALFCHNDWLALSAVRLLEKHGFRIPQDVSVLGVDNSPTFNTLCPDISSISYPSAWLASQVPRILKGLKTNPAPSWEVVTRKTS